MTRLYRVLFYFAVGTTVALIAIVVWRLDNLPDLKVWHTANLDAEFTRSSGIKTFEEYLALEDRLFDQLDVKVYSQLEPTDKSKLNRYHRGSLVAPRGDQQNGNRSFELKSESPKIGVLLLHGMLDSPYSMHSIAKGIHEKGGWVVGLRIPGHGTAPVGMTNVTWQDMAAAVKLAITHLEAEVDGAPLYIVGFSNGGALAVQYTLTSLQDSSMPAVQGLVLLAPEIGVSKLAALAVWQERLGHVLGMEKLQWGTIMPEYDTYKYISFAINAGKQAHLITSEIQQQMDELAEANRLQSFPPILCFQSVVDATVIAQTLVEKLLDRLPQRHNELVLFDINRNANIEPLIVDNPSDWLDAMLADRSLGYTRTLITNKDKNSDSVVALSKAPGNNQKTIEHSLDTKWPDEVYSLSHVALPFSQGDPFYGNIKPKTSRGLQLGSFAPRGEHNILIISATEWMRLRWNPFYAYQESRILSFLGLTKS